MSSDGVITNTADLGAGIYNLGVSVRDTLGNILNGSFQITVQSTGFQYDMNLIYLGVATVGIIVLVLFIIRKRM